MATIGFDKVYYSKITEDSSGNETYGSPIALAKGIQADIQITYANGELYADDALAERVEEFVSGTLALNVANLASGVAADLLGVRVDSNGVVVSAAEDTANYVAVGARAKMSNGKYKYFWLYRVLFAAPNSTMTTKNNSISFNTPTINGTIFRRNKVDSAGKHPWKVDVDESETGVIASVITSWYSSVYEPTFAVQQAQT